MWDQDIYIKTWNFASDAHKHQFMPGSDIPYINHIGLVTMEAMTAIALSNSTAIQHPDLVVKCALLHDAIEDTTVTFNEISKTFGEQTAQGVWALTKNETLPTKREQMLDSLTRIKQQPLEIGMVKLADRITNLQTPPSHWTKEKINYYRDEAILILNELGNCNEYLANRLAEKIENYITYC